MVATYYVIFMICLTTTYSLWSWWHWYPAHAGWIEWLGPEGVRRYRYERRVTLAVTLFTILATNGTMAFVLLSTR